MTTPTATALAFWSALEARDWSAFGALVADDVVYELPQTRERIRGKAKSYEPPPGREHLVERY